MNRIVCLTILFLAVFSMCDSVCACTSFAVYSGQVFYGVNFDFADAVMKFLITTNGDLKTFHLAFERAFGDVRFFVKTAGMNTKGLFGACQELHPLGDSPRQPEKDPLQVFELYEKIDGAADVHDLETILEKARLVNLPGLIFIIFLRIHAERRW